MSRYSESRNSSPSSIRSSIASASVVVEPSDRLLRSECRKQGGKNCGHVECQMRPSRRSDRRHNGDQDVPSQPATPLTLSPTLSTTSSMTDAGGGGVRFLRNRQHRSLALLESGASAATTTSRTTRTITTTYTSRRVVSSAGLVNNSSSSRSVFKGLKSRLAFSSNNSNRSEVDEAEVDQNLEDKELEHASPSSSSSFRQSLAGGFSSLWRSNQATGSARKGYNDEKDIDESQLSDAEEEKGSIEARLGVKQNELGAENGQELVNNNRLNPLMWLISAIYYYIRLARSTSAAAIVFVVVYFHGVATALVNKFMSGTTRSVAIVTRGAYWTAGLFSTARIKRLAVYPLVSMANICSFVLSYAREAFVTIGRSSGTASRSATSGLVRVLQLPVSASRTVFVTIRQGFTSESTVFFTSVVSERRPRRYCMCFVLPLLFLLLLILLLLLRQPNQEIKQVLVSSSGEMFLSAARKFTKVASESFTTAASFAGCLLLWLRDSAIAIAAFAANSTKSWPFKASLPDHSTKLSDSFSSPSNVGCSRAELSALELQTSNLKSAFADLERQQRVRTPTPTPPPPPPKHQQKPTVSTAKLASADALDALVARLNRLESQFANVELSASKLTASIEAVANNAEKAAQSSTKSTESLSASLSSKIANVASQVENVAERLNRRTDEAIAGSADALTAAGSVNSSVQSLFTELHSLRADLVRLGNQYRRQLASLAERQTQLASLVVSQKEHFTSRDSVSSGTIDQLRRTVLDSQNRLKQLESKQQNVHSLPSLSSVSVPNNSSWCQSPADQLPDFALFSAGAYAVSVRCTRVYSAKRSYLSLFGLSIIAYSNGPNVALQPGIQLGECWPFAGFPGHLVVRLAVPARVHSVTIDHVPRSLTYNGAATSAPRNFSIYGLLSESDSFSEAQLLGNFVYDAETGPASQTFTISTKDGDSRPAVYPAVELLIHSNHGAEHTCLYRFRVHGTPGDLS